jgi:hypothetical protein
METRVDELGTWVSVLGVSWCSVGGVERARPELGDVLGLLEEGTALLDERGSMESAGPGMEEEG